jgi:hypothetical protein
MVSVAVPGCLSWILIFFFIPDPGNNDSKKEKGKKEISCLTFFVAIYFTKL